MFTLLLIASFPYICLGFFLLGIFLVETENFGWTTISLIVMSCLVGWLKPYGIPQWVIAHIPLCLGFLAAYLGAGILWSFVKWYSYLLDHRSKFVEIKNNFLATKNDLMKSQQEFFHNKLILVNNKPVLVDDEPLMSGDASQLYINSHKDFNKKYDDFYSAQAQYRRFYKPTASNHKGKIISWMCFWPYSLIGTFINDPVKRLFTFIFNWLKSTYQKISDKVFSDFPEK